MRFDVVGIDGPCVDLAVNVNEFPRPNRGQRIQELSWQGGGKVATGMVAAARLGARGAILGTVGDDRYGQFCIRDFNDHGIDTEHMLARQGETTSLSVVISDAVTMGRSILYRPGTAEKLKEEELPKEYLLNTRYLFISGLNEVVKKAVRMARAAGAQVVIDADSYSEELKEEIPFLDIFIGSEFVYHALFPKGGNYEENCRMLMKQGPAAVVFTFGEKGCVGISREGYFELPSYAVRAVDTVGAGDVFHGAFIAGLLLGYAADKAARFASAVSAVKCTRIGGRAGIPTREVAERFMETGVIDYEEINKRVDKYRRGIEYV